MPRTKQQLHHFTVDLFATFDPASHEGSLFRALFLEANRRHIRPWIRRHPRSLPEM